MSKALVFRAGGSCRPAKLYIPSVYLVIEKMVRNGGRLWLLRGLRTVQGDFVSPGSQSLDSRQHMSRCGFEEL